MGGEPDRTGGAVWARFLTSEARSKEENKNSGMEMIARRPVRAGPPTTEMDPWRDRRASE